MDEILDETRAPSSGLPEEVIWIAAMVLAFGLPWLANWSLVAFLACGVVFAVWGGTVVLKMGNHLRANGVHLSDDVFIVAAFFSWVMVILLLLRFGGRAVYAHN